MFSTPAHKSSTAGQVTPGLAALHAKCVPQPDFRFANHGSICILTPLTDAGEDWAAEHLEGATAWGLKGVVIEPRYAGPILEGIVADGLEVA